MWASSKTDLGICNFKALFHHKKFSFCHNLVALSKCLDSMSGVNAHRNYATRNSKKRLGGSYSMYVKDRKMGMTYEEEEKLSRKEITMDGLRILHDGLPELKKEWIEKFKGDINLFADHQDFEYLFQADNKESMKGWSVSTDTDYEVGKSSAKFSVSRSNKAVFHGFINTDVPNDGKTQRSGFCNLRSPQKYSKLSYAASQGTHQNWLHTTVGCLAQKIIFSRLGVSVYLYDYPYSYEEKKSFQRQIPYDWSMYTHLYLRVRGDGRNYMINLHPDRYFDVHWMDLYQYPLYTRGGPYWQFVKIPFANFFLSAVGRLQDNQEMVDLTHIRCLSINAMDYRGPFELEIDYIAMFYDANDDNPHLYELYEKSPYDFE